MIQEMKVIWGDDYTTGCLLKFTNARKYESEKLQIRTLITLFKWLYIFIEDNDLLKKYNTIWNKVRVYIEKIFDSLRVYNKKRWWS